LLDLFDPAATGYVLVFIIRAAVVGHTCGSGGRWASIRYVEAVVVLALLRGECLKLV
jgi:hypothetical protein